MNFSGTLSLVPGCLGSSLSTQPTQEERLHSPPFPGPSPHRAGFPEGLTLTE